jgi:hypothetical protein
MRGRRPSGPGYVEQVSGSKIAKDRARAVLETLTGARRVLEVCQELRISEQRFQQLRAEAVTAAVASMEPGQAGRPKKTPSAEQFRIAQLEQQLADVQVELKAAQARAEIALFLPRTVQAKEVQAASEKKTRRQRKLR